MINIISEKKTIKVNDIYLTLANYKEPLKAIEPGKGYGFYGVLLQTPDGEHVQCHICGKLYKSLHAHVRQTHKIMGHRYKEHFGLAFGTALISENQRIELKERTLAWLHSLTPEQKEAYRLQNLEHAKKGTHLRGDHQPPLQLESHNKRGTCPDQLLDKIKEAVRHYNRTPTLHEFVQYCDSQRYKHLIFKVFGSWKNALHMIDLQPKEREKGGFIKYTDAELLEYLRMFAEGERKLPTATDCRRGILPGYAVYLNRFGSMEKARELAGVYNFVSRPIRVNNRKPKVYIPGTVYRKRDVPISYSSL